MFPKRDPARPHGTGPSVAAHTAAHAAQTLPTPDGTYSLSPHGEVDFEPLPRGALSLCPYVKDGHVRYVWNATRLAPPPVLQAAEGLTIGRGWTLQPDELYPAPFYVPGEGDFVLLFGDDGRPRLQRVDFALVQAFIGRRERRDAGMIVLAGR